jgi:hypothetical protein
MAECAHCRAATELYYGGVPTCVKCSTAREATRKPPATESEIRAILTKELAKAKVRAAEACDSFNEIMGRVPSPHGTQQIHNASRKLSSARKEMMKAHNRLYNYLRRGIVPEDLKAKVKKATA